MQRTIVSAQYTGNARTGMEKKKTVYKTMIQIQELKDMYMEGVSSSGKTVTPEVAYERMKTRVTTDGIRFYSKSSENGELLNVNPPCSSNCSASKDSTVAAASSSFKMFEFIIFEISRAEKSLTM